jgi:hypothetical protein
MTEASDTRTQEEKAEEREKICTYAAPVFAIPVGLGGGWRLVQGNCHHWDCPRCGRDVARGHYGRIVSGIEELQGHDWYLLTVTARGAGMTRKQAEDGWLLWTNRLFTRMRAAADTWYYASVTERQKRGHPHSHTLITFRPKDGADVQRWTWQDTPAGRRKVLKWLDDDCSVPDMTTRSAWLSERVVAAGFGPVWDLTRIRTPKGAARYVAKYMFKDMSFEKWPDRWKRVRYSQSWPPKDERDKTPGVVPILTDSDLIHFLDDNNASYDNRDATLDKRVKNVREKQRYHTGDKMDWGDTAG